MELLFCGYHLNYRLLLNFSFKENMLIEKKNIWKIPIFWLKKKLKIRNITFFFTKLQLDRFGYINFNNGRIFSFILWQNKKEVISNYILSIKLSACTSPFLVWKIKISKIIFKLQIYFRLKKWLQSFDNFLRNSNFLKEKDFPKYYRNLNINI